MYELRVIGVEGENLVASSETGEQFLVVVDDVLHSQLRQLARTERSAARFSPREVQSLLREGVALEEVARRTGAEPADVERFAGPVLAERDHIVSTAQAVPVSLGVADEEASTFGSVISRRLSQQGATGERWSARKPAGEGWIVSVAFVAGEVEREATWSFDHRRGALSALDQDATTLSRQGEPREGLIPRLRAVDAPNEPRPERPERSDRFDSGAFVVEEEPGRGGDARVGGSARPDEPQGQTADLLDALRRRRGERELAPVDAPGADVPRAAPEPPSARPDEDSLTLDFPLPAGGEPAESREPEPTAPTPAARADRDDVVKPGARRGRPAMPSWDEIVFGTRSDDDAS